MDVTELHDEENLLVQMQDRWENYGSLDAIVDTHDPFTLEGAPRTLRKESCPTGGNHPESRSEETRHDHREITASRRFHSALEISESIIKNNIGLW